MSSTLTNLTAATTWSGTDLFYALVGGNSRKIAASSFWTCDAANVLSDVNSTTAQTVRIYRTFTDSSNYERLALQSGSGYLELAAQTAGTGTDNLDLRLTPAGNGAVNVVSSTTSGHPFKVTSNNAASFTGTMELMAPNITTGQKALWTFGKADVSGNCVSGMFAYVGDNDATNEFSYAFSGAGAHFAIERAGTTRLFNHVTIPAGGSVNARLLLGITATFGVYVGSGAPTVTAGQGSLYLRTDGSSSSTRLYVNSSGSTTWVNVTTAS